MPPTDTDIDELEDVELDELEETDEPAAEAAPKGKAKKVKAEKKPAVEKPTFGSTELAAHVSKETGKTYDGKAIRVLLRKLAKDGVLQRTVGEDRARYSFTGSDDPQVAAIVTAVKSGALEREKAASLETAKATKAAKKTPKKAPKAAEAAAEDDDEVEELED